MAHDKVAEALIREVPAGQINKFLANFSANKFGNEVGTGCGAGCGGGCADATGLVFDRFGHSGITAADLQAAKADKPALKAAVTTAVGKLVG